MQERSKSGVLINENFKDSLIIDKYESEFHQWRQKKLDHLRSENSEDALSWNMFRSLKQIDPSLWLPKLFIDTFQKNFAYSCISIEVLLWEKLNPPSTLTTQEGQTEVDIIIKSNDFVWFIEAKYKSDINMGTTHDTKRNQVIRNIDVGLEYAKGKDFYFSLLILDEQHSPKGLSMTNYYRNSIDTVKKDLPHRKGELSNLHGIGVFSWFDLHELFNRLSTAANFELEKFVAKQASTWLEDKIFQYFEPKSGANFDDTRTYRYSLSRVWDAQKEKIVFIGLNPSTADEKVDDQTLKRCINYAKRWSNGKYGSLEMVNLFAYRSTDYKQLRHVQDPIGKQNDQFILKAINNASLVVVAWGENGSYLNRDKAVLNLLSKANVPVYCLEILRGGQPKHPLYAKGDLIPILYEY